MSVARKFLVLLAFVLFFCGSASAGQLVCTQSCAAITPNARGYSVEVRDNVGTLVYARQTSVPRQGPAPNSSAQYLTQVVSLMPTRLSAARYAATSGAHSTEVQNTSLPGGGSVIVITTYDNNGNVISVVVIVVDATGKVSKAIY